MRAGESAPEPEAAALEKKVDAYLTPLVESGAFSGSVLLAKGGKVLIENAYGLANLDKHPNTCADVPPVMAGH